MPRKALRCLVELQVHAITCPGVYLPHRDDVYISIHLFGENRKSQLLSPTFPLLFHERFKISKVFYTAFEPSQVASNLEIEPVTIELIQLTGAYGTVLASHTSSAKEFLYPYPGTSYAHRTQDRDLLMDRSIHFPGIAPKLEFSTKTTISETNAPTMDIYDDLSLIRALNDDPYSRVKSARRSRSRTRSRGPQPTLTSRSRSRARSSNRGSQRYQRSTATSATRCRSASPDRLVGRMSSLRFDDDVEFVDDEPRPPFVVRHVDSDKLIGRVPGTLPPNERRRRSRSAGRSRRVYGSGTSGYYGNGYSSLDDDYVVRGSHTQPRNYTYLSDEDRDFADYLNAEYLRRFGARSVSFCPVVVQIPYEDDYAVAAKYGRRLRAASPVSYRRPLQERYDDPTYRYTDINSSVGSALRRNRYDNQSRLHSSYPHQRHLEQEMEDLKVDLELARTRRDLEDDYDRRAMFPGISMSPRYHREQFNSKLYNSYNDMYPSKHRPFYS